MGRHQAFAHATRCARQSDLCASTIPIKSDKFVNFPTNINLALGDFGVIEGKTFLETPL